MAKRRKRRVKSIPLTIGQDPSLWRFGSVHEALEANIGILSELIRASQPVDQPEEPVIDERDIDDTVDPIAAR
jgi:hypothetical protein